MASKRNMNYAAATGKNANSQGTMAQLHKLVVAAGCVVNDDGVAGAEWLRNNYAKSPLHETVVTPNNSSSTSVQAQETKKKHVAIRGVDAKRFVIRLPKNHRRDLYLEPEFVTALNKVVPNNQNEWLCSRVVEAGDGNLASTVRCAIVRTLLEGKQL